MGITLKDSWHPGRRLADRGADRARSGGHGERSVWYDRALQIILTEFALRSYAVAQKRESATNETHVLAIRPFLVFA